MGACDYCDFYSITAKSDDEQLDFFVDRVLEDVFNTMQSEGVTDVPSVYIGGGTPSFLGAERIELLLGGLQRFLPNVPIELTIEANPESIDRNFLESQSSRAKGSRTERQLDSDREND